MVALIIAGVMGILFSLYVAIGTPNMVHVSMSVVRADYCTMRIILHQTRTILSL
jgi:hypothetical protein